MIALCSDCRDEHVGHKTTKISEAYTEAIKRVKTELFPVEALIKKEEKIVKSADDEIKVLKDGHPDKADIRELIEMLD